MFDATKVDPLMAENPIGELCNTSVTIFNVGFSPIKRSLQVAVTLLAALGEVVLVIGGS
jgi:hypothetical protein